MLAWRQKSKELNLEAVRRQMQGYPVTRRYLLDTGPAFDFLFHRRDVDLRAHAAPCRGQGGYHNITDCLDPLLSCG